MPQLKDFPNRHTIVNLLYSIKASTLKDQQFITNMRVRHDKYGEEMYLTEAQVEWITHLNTPRLKDYPEVADKFVELLEQATTEEDHQLSFIESLWERYVQYKNEMYITEKQLNWLFQLQPQ